MKIFDILKREEIKTLTDNFTLIVAIPYVIGGLWQFIQLTEISMDLVKFFSLTQLLIDGLLILAQYAGLYLISFFLSSYITDLKIKYERTYALVGVLVLILVIVSGFATAYQINNNGKSDVIKWCMISFIVFFIILFSFALDKMSILGQIIFVVVTFSVITTVFKQANKIQNIDILTSKLQIIYPNVELSYYNDQFLFYETNRKQDDNKIIIKKIDDIFDLEK